MDFSDTGAIVLGWLVWLSIVLGLVGVVAFDAISLGVTSLGVTDDAQAAAMAGATAYRETKNVDRAYEAAVRFVHEHNANEIIAPRSFTVSPDGRVSLTLEREAVTVVARYLPTIKDRLVLQGSGEATTPL